MTKTWEKQHAKVLRFEVSVGAEDADRTIEEFERDIRDGLDLVKSINNVTTSGGYYIVDGKVCLTKDYDKNTQNFKHGATSPQWAGGPPPPPAEKVDHSVEAVAPTYERVEGFKKPERDPLTGRKIRADKGKPRGPRKPKEPADE
jgi:hypothetical protein